ncbi:MAG: NUDIX hydrolase [Candidatus Nanohaloarchaea archaeon]
MDRASFPVVVTGVVVAQGEVLLAKKEEDEGHPIGGEWHFPGGFMEGGEQPEEAVKRELKEEIGLEVDVHHLVDVYHEEKGDLVRVFYYCEADSRDLEPGEDLEELEWVEPEKVVEKLSDGHEAAVVSDRQDIENLMEKLAKMPSFR